MTKLSTSAVSLFLLALGPARQTQLLNFGIGSVSATAPTATTIVNNDERNGLLRFRNDFKSSQWNDFRYTTDRASEQIIDDNEFDDIAANKLVVDMKSYRRRQEEIQHHY